MCEYCDQYVKLKDYCLDYVDIMATSRNLVDGMLEDKVSLYIDEKNRFNTEPVFKMCHSYEFRNFSGGDEVERSVPITYCPFCGVKLKEAREEYEKAAD